LHDSLDENTADTATPALRGDPHRDEPCAISERVVHDTPHQTDIAVVA
jgi:hypothetical protein